MKLRKGWRMSCDVGETTEVLQNELWRRWSSAHSPTLPSLHLRQSSFSNPFVALPTSQLILKPFRSFTYVTAHSPTLLSLFLRHRLFTYVTWRAAHVLFILVCYTELKDCISGIPRSAASFTTSRTLIICLSYCEVFSLVLGLALRNVSEIFNAKKVFEV